MAQHINLTDRWLRSKNTQPGDYWDGHPEGFGVRVSATGRKSFILAARYPNAGAGRRTLGKYDPMTLEAARERARKWLELIRRGIDPALEEERAKQAEQVRTKTTFAAVAEDFIAQKTSKERQGDEAARMVRRDLMPKLGHLPITDVTDVDVIGIVKAKAEKYPTQAWHVFSVAKRLFAWAKDQRVYGLKHNPCAELKPKSFGAEKGSRERVLSDDEILALWRAAERVGYPAGPAIRLLLLTGLRLNEAVGAARSEFDWRHGVWVIPKERMKLTRKGARAHVVPLIDKLKEIVDALPQFSGDYLFSYDFGRSPAVLGDKIKKRMDARMLRTLKALARVRGEDPKRVKLESWKNLDLRRTVRTNLSRLKVQHEVAEAVLAHAKPGVVGVYNRDEHFDEKREALKLWAAKLRSIVEPPPRNVIQLDEARA